MIKTIQNPIKEIPDFIDIIFENFKDLKYIDDAHHTHRYIKRLLERAEKYCLISLDDDMTTINGYIVGEKQLLIDGRMVFYITYLYVSPTDRNRGIGKCLIKRIISKCNISFGIKFIMLMCNKKNELNNFYSKLGFVEDPIIKLKNMDVLILFL